MSSHMATTQGAKRQIKVQARKRLFNDRRRRTMRETVKEFRKLIEAGDKKSAEAMMPTLQKAIDKAAKSGVIKDNTAARKKSRLVKALTA